jgi:hypothetical protein
MVDGGDNNTATVHKGQPVYTTGDVIAEGEIVATGQVRSSGVTTLAAITGSGAQTAQSLNPLLGEVFTLASSPSGSASITLNATSVPAGARITLIISQGSVNTLTITFGNNMLSAGTYATSSNNTAYAISFVSDGEKFVETARTAAQS